MQTGRQLHHKHLQQQQLALLGRQGHVPQWSSPTCIRASHTIHTPCVCPYGLLSIICRALGCVQVTGLREGDHVVPLGSALGTWRSEGVWQAADWHKVPSDLPLPAAATLAINPPTALLMLEDVVKLQPGDVVVQNGATSGVGQVRGRQCHACSGLHIPARSLRDVGSVCADASCRPPK